MRMQLGVDTFYAISGAIAGRSVRSDKCHDDQMATRRRLGLDIGKPTTQRVHMSKEPTR